MSHQANIEVDDVKVSEEAHLIAGLKAVFGEEGVEVHDQPTDLRLYNGQVARGKTSWGEFTPCNIIVRRATMEKKLGRIAASNDLGYRRNSDGTYTLLADVAGFPKELQEQVWEETNISKATAKVRAQGYKVTRSVLEGRTVLTATKRDMKAKV